MLRRSLARRSADGERGGLRQLDSGRAVVEAERQAKGRAAAAAERAERRLVDAIAALLERAAQPVAAVRQHDILADAHRVGRELNRVGLIEGDAETGRDARV